MATSSFEEFKKKYSSNYTGGASTTTSVIKNQTTPSTSFEEFKQKYSSKPTTQTVSQTAQPSIRSTIPSEWSSPQNIAAAKNLMNATSTMSYDQAVKKDNTFDMIRQPVNTSAGDTILLPKQVVEDYQKYEQEKEPVLKTPDIMKDNFRRFEDGYNFGDITKTGLETVGDTALSVAGTVGDVGLNIAKGVLSVPENMAKAGASAVAGIADFVGADDWANNIRRNVAYKNIYTDPTQKAIDVVDKASIAGTPIDNIASGIGQVGGTVAVSKVLGKAGLDSIGFMPTTAVLQGVGSGATEAYQKTDASVGLENMTWKEKLQNALKIGGSGVLAGSAEGLFGLFGVGGTPFTTKIGNALINKASTPMLKVLTKMGYSGLGEAGEEFLEYIGNVGLNNLINKFGATDYSTEFDGKEIAKEALTSFIVSAITQGGSSSIQMRNIANQQISQIEKEIGRKLTPNEIKQVANNIADQLLIESEEIDVSESPQTEQTQSTNEVIPLTTQNQNTANVVQNNANMQNNVQNQSNIEQISQNNVENAPNLQKTVQIKTQEEKTKQLRNAVQQYIDKVKYNFNTKINILKISDSAELKQANESTIYKKAKNLFSNIQKNVFINNGEKIRVTNTDISESIGKTLRNTHQKEVLDVNLAVFSQLDKIIENGEKILGDVPELKNRNKYKNWDYYATPIVYDGKKYVVEFDTVIRQDGEKHFRLERVIPIKNEEPSMDVPTKTLTTPLPEGSSINNIIQSNENYVNTLPTQAEQRQKLKEKTGFMLANEGDSYKRNMFNNNAKAINDLIKAKRIISDEFDIKIRAKQELLNSKKDKTTKVAQNLQTQIINLQKRKANAEQKFIKQIDRLENRNATINKLKKQVSEDRLPTRKEIKQDIITQTDLENINLDNTKDLSKFIMNNTTPLRVNEKIFDRETAKKINDTFFRPIKTNEADRIRFLNKERSEIQSLGIEPRSEESEYVQIYGEGEWVNPDTGEATPYTLDNLKKQFPENWEKIKNAAEVIREKYDTYLDAVNKELNKMGYDSIPKLKNYFRHFEETTSLLDQIGIPSKADHLPTDLNGLTSDLRPGKNFFANALSRTGKKTTYDAITGIDGYLEGVSKLMYHTEDIQKLRTFDEYIRNKYGKNADLEGLNTQEFNQRVEQIQDGHLSEYAAWLSEYTNNLAGKKSKIDRGMEDAFGRRIYGTLNAIKKQVGSNLTGLNLNSALSNFISITQGASKTSKLAMLEGLEDTLKNIFIDDGFINKSDFLTRRFGSDKLSKTTWEKMSNAGQIFMAGTDYFSANLITRSKYHEYLNKGYPENEAMRLADEFADRLMGGRALGDMPNIFNSKTLGILTQFQLENVNQFDSMFHDTKYEDRAAEQTKYEAKTLNEKLKSKLAKEKPEFYNSLSATLILGQLFAYAWAYNKVDEELTGSGGAFDPIGIIEDLIKDFTNPNVSKGQAVANLAKNVIDVIPYANILTGGGRVPMTDAIPNIVDLLEGESNLGSELWKVANLALPTGGGQLRKTAQAAGALIQGGDYKTNANGEKQLKFPIAQEGNAAQRIAEGAQALLFGKWATPRGKEYIENGFKSLSAVETEGLEEAKKVGIDTTKYYEIRDSIKALKIPKFKDKTGKEKSVEGARKKMIKEELNSRKDLTEEQKGILFNIFYKREL